MKYLFFDCECANCYNHEGKICSFGYVITDEAFHVLEQKDIIINPDAPFDPHVLGQGERSIDLAYTPLRFEHAPKFDALLCNYRWLVNQSRYHGSLAMRLRMMLASSSVSAAATTKRSPYSVITTSKPSTSLRLIGIVPLP
jgi:hypothetical protein